MSARHRLARQITLNLTFEKHRNACGISDDSFALWSEFRRRARELTSETRQLPNRARAAACEGERFAERMEDQA